MKLNKLFLGLLVASQAIAADVSVCRGQKAVYTPRAVVKVAYLDTSGLALDNASRLKVDRLNLVRKYLKKSYWSGYMWDATREEWQAFHESIGRGGHTQQIDDLMKRYTFRFPLKMVEGLFKEPRQEGQIHYGYDFDSQTWQASLALEGADWMWNNYLWRQTHITEVARESGEVVFEVSLDLNLFCQTSVLRTDLLSR